ncbi:MAG: DUF3667 domain-containing protein [Flavobacteriales bacterium]|nr:DUF3667 domain-containing protein [Flavobacteriales bacterium]
MSCGNRFEGRYCNVCGEKVVEEADFSFRKISGEIVSNLFNFESKVFRSLGALFVRPGQLSLNFVEGQRVNYLRPIQLFLFANIVFFIFLADVDIFRAPSQWFFAEGTASNGIRAMLGNAMASQGKDESEIAVMYDNLSSNLAKGLVILLIPVIGVVSWLLNLRKSFAFGKHVIFASHYFTFLLLFCVALLLIYFVFQVSGRSLYLYPILGAMLIYYLLAHRKFFRENIFVSFLKSSAAVLLILAILQYYRMAVSYYSLWVLT